MQTLPSRLSRSGRPHRYGVETIRSAGEPYRLSAVIPCFNEEAVIEETHKRLAEALFSLPDIECELIFVDDGSDDRTLDLLKQIQAADKHVRIVSFSRNFGHQVAVSAGLEHASGDAVVLIDADLQDPPEVIHKMIARWRQGADVVYGVRQEREGETAFKLWTANLFYRLVNRVSEIPIPLDTGDFRLMDRQVVQALLAMPERDRFIRGMVAWTGFRQEPLRYKRSRRFAGSTKYPFTRMLRFAADGILSFSLVPLRLAIAMGFLVAGLSFIGIIYALVMRLVTDIWVPGWTLLFIASLFVGGVQLIFLGIIGEYVGRSYGEAKRRPLYLVKARFGFDETSEGAEPRSLNQYL